MAERKSYQSELSIEKTIQKKVQGRYLLYLPEDYHGDTNKKWPLIMFLHGAGEQGDDLALVKKHGIPRRVDKKKAFPFVVVSPQCPKGYWWSNDVLIALLDDIIANYRIDEDRVYLTGISMGGYATWELAIEYPDRFAAIAPICGGGDPYLIERIKHIPVWAFHGEKDRIVKAYKSKRLVNALKKAGGNVKLTIYPGMRHDAWTVTYQNERLYEWFLSYKRKSQETVVVTDTRSTMTDTSV